MDITLFFQHYADAFEHGSPEAVTAFLRQSLAEAENDVPAQIAILNETAGYFRCISRFAESIEAAERALFLLRKIGYEDTVPYGTTLLNAATAYRAEGDNAKAMTLFIASLGVLKAGLKEDDHRIAGLYNNIAEMHKEAGNAVEALELLQHAASIMAAKPEMEGDYAIVLSNLGSVLLELQRTTEACATLTTAKDIFDKHGERDGKLAPHYAAVLAGMSALHFRNGCFKKAAETYEEALVYIEKSFGQNANYAITCQNCADAYEALGNYAKARIMAEKSRAITQNCTVPWHNADD